MTTFRAPGSYLEVAPGVELYYEDRGAGPAVILLPGWTFTTEAFDQQVAHLSDRYRVVAVDQRSHGRSTVALHGNDYGTFGRDLAVLIDRLDLTDVVLVGWSFGCLTSWSYVRHAGLDRIRAVVSIDLSPRPLSTDADDWIEGPLGEIGGAFNTYLSTPDGHRGFVAAYAEEVMVQRDLEPAELAWIVDQSLRTPTPIAALLFASGMFSDHLEEAALLDRSVPTLFVVAEHWADTAQRFLAQHCPRGQVEVLGGHMMFWEHPERFNALLDRFLAQL